MTEFDEVTEFARSLIRKWLIDYGTEVAQILRPEERKYLTKLAQITIRSGGATFPDDNCLVLWRELQYGSERMPSYQLDRWVTGEIDLRLKNMYTDEVQ